LINDTQSKAGSNNTTWTRPSTPPKEKKEFLAVGESGARWGVAQAGIGNLPEKIGSDIALQNGPTRWSRVKGGIRGKRGGKGTTFPTNDTEKLVRW